jgi:PKD repeat protein
MRSPAGAWGDLRPLSGEYTGYADPHPATDGRDFVVAASPQLGALKQVLVSVFDPVPPVVAPIAVSGSTTAGDATTLSATATDTWSAIPTATWAFGDGAIGTGLSASHAYANAGSYTATLTVIDAAGNATARSIALTIAAAQSTLTTATFSGKWTASRIKGTLLVKGTAPRAGTYAVDVFSGATRTLHSSLTLPAGAFSNTLKLPAKFLPGTYRVALVPGFPATVVLPASRTANLAAPAEGVVDRVVLSGKNGGPSARTLKGAKTIWVSFRFAAVPKGALKLTWYRKGKKGKRVALGSTTKNSGKKVGSYLKLGGTLHGTFTAVLSRKGKVIAQGSVKAT